MSSVFISYSHDPTDPQHGERVAGLAASLIRDGITVFFDQNRGDEEEKVPWPIWMEDKIEVADHVLLVCTKLYFKKVRQQLGEGAGRGVCWEANLIYNHLYTRLNTTKFVPILFSNGHNAFIPGPLKGSVHFVLDSDQAYGQLYAFLTGQHRRHFPGQGSTLVPIAQQVVEPLFSLKGAPSPPPVTTPAASVSSDPASRDGFDRTLRPDDPPVARRDIRGLDWYDECDAAHFLGREEPTNQLLAMLLSNPVVRLVGPSGVGKSSLIRGGLLPRVREFGWRACLIRPFEDPANRIPEQASAKLLEGGAAFTAPIDPEKFRADVSRRLVANGNTRLVLLLDQLEDIVSPMAAPDAVQTVRLLMQEFWQHRDQKPYLRAVIVSRTEADLVLARLWQEISGRSEGVPYLALQGLTVAVTKTIIEDTAKESGWRLAQGAAPIVQQLAEESRFLNYSGEVFPVYLQIVLKQLQDAGGQDELQDIENSPRTVSSLIGRYLENTLAKLEARGGDWRHCGAVLEALSRASGTKATQSSSDLVRETSVGVSVLNDILSVLVSERLVRPVGHNTFEIQHDRLAEAVIERMKDDDREAKAAREFLSAKAVAFEWTKSPLTTAELVYLYQHRQRIHPTNRELRVIFVSFVRTVMLNSRNPSRSDGSEPSSAPAWFWFRDVSITHYLRWLAEVLSTRRAGVAPEIEIESVHGPRRAFPFLWFVSISWQEFRPHFTALAGDANAWVHVLCADILSRVNVAEALTTWSILAKDDDPEVRVEVVRALASVSQKEALALLSKLAKDRVPGVRKEAAKALARLSQPEVLVLLPELSRDEDWSVRREAVNALARFSQPEALAFLRELSKDQDSDVRGEAAATLASFSQPEDLALWRQLAEDEDAGMRKEAVKALATFSKPEDLLLLRKLAKDEEPDVRCEAVKALALFSLPEDVALLRELAKDEVWDVRQGAVTALASFSQPEAIAFLRELVKDQGSDMRHEAVTTLATFSKPEDLALLRELAMDEDPLVREAATKELASSSQPEDLALLRELAVDEDPAIRQVAINALASFSQPEALWILRELAKDETWDVRQNAMEALTRSSQREAIAPLCELARDKDWFVQQQAIKALARFSQPEALALLRELNKNADSNVRYQVVKALASSSKPVTLTLLRDSARDEDSDVRQEVVNALANSSQPEDLALLRELTKDKDRTVRLRAIERLTALSIAAPPSLSTESTKKGSVLVEATRAEFEFWSLNDTEAFMNERDHDCNRLVVLDELLYLPKWLRRGTYSNLEESPGPRQ